MPDRRRSAEAGSAPRRPRAPAARRRRDPFRWSAWKCRRSGSRCPRWAAPRNPDLVKPAARRSRLSCSRCGQRDGKIHLMRQAMGHAQLQRRRGGEGEELMRLGDHRDQLARSHHPADLPAGQRKDLSRRTDPHGTARACPARSPAEYAAGRHRSDAHRPRRRSPPALLSRTARASASSSSRVEHPADGIERRVDQDGAGACGVIAAASAASVSRQSGGASVTVLTTAPAASAMGR